jgi:hypothetical protein
MSAIILMVRCHSNERLVSHLHMGLGQMAKRIQVMKGHGVRLGRMIPVTLLSLDIDDETETIDPGQVFEIPILRWFSLNLSSSIRDWYHSPSEPEGSHYYALEYREGIL